MLVIGRPLLAVVDGQQHDPAESGDHAEGDLQQVEHLGDVEDCGIRQVRPAEEPQQPAGGHARDDDPDEQPRENGHRNAP
ncbi:hypothetical protein [Amycolatopsis sp. NBC_01286]|uniref:hypothetical protein n=1 Tax=Amycolatopsis sp. NBC_01286 TaxID=2903560 RepID=UPI002E0D3D28|nr:hypothetical protein OG570_11915 [Amycolatopsis sp. NBC_01286]